MKRLYRIFGLVGAVLLLAVGTVGCASRNHGGGTGIIVTNAYVTQPASLGKTTTAYVDITNNGTYDQLVSVSTSVGGTVVLRAPDSADKSPIVMHTVATIPLPSDTFVQLDPDSYHLLISGAGAMHDGKDIQLTFHFAHAAPITTYAIVTNPQNGGSSYFLN